MMLTATTNLHSISLPLVELFMKPSTQYTSVYYYFTYVHFDVQLSTFNHLKQSGIRQLHFEVFSAMQV